MTEYVQMLRDGGRGFLRKSCSPEEFQSALGVIVEPDFRQAGALAIALSSHPLASVDMLQDLVIPPDRRKWIARAISGTPNAEIYELAVCLALDEEGLERVQRPSFAHTFCSEPDEEGVQLIAGRLLDAVRGGRLNGLVEVLSHWVSLGVLTDAQDKAIIETILSRATPQGGWCDVVGEFPAEVAVPWLLQAAEDLDPQTSAVAISELRRKDCEIPHDLLMDISQSTVRAGALLDMCRGANLLLSDVDPSFRLAATQAKAAMAWKFLCESGIGMNWSFGDPEPEIEQIDIIDGESAETTGAIFVYKCRSAQYDYPEWSAGTAGPYSVGEEPARHLGGLDYTAASLGGGTLGEQVEGLIGVRLQFSTLAVKPAD